MQKCHVPIGSFLVILFPWNRPGRICFIGTRMNIYCFQTKWDLGASVTVTLYFGWFRNYKPGFQFRENCRPWVIEACVKEAGSTSLCLYLGLLKWKFDHWNGGNFNPIKSIFMGASSIVIFNYSLNAICIVEMDELAHLLAIYKYSRFC